MNPKIGLTQMANSPTQRTLALLRKENYVCQVVERYCAFSKKRVDLFNCIDIVACKVGEGIVGIQTTSASNHSARVKKAIALPSLLAWLASGGRFSVWSWGKNKKGKWEVRRQELTQGDLLCIPVEEEEHPLDGID